MASFETSIAAQLGAHVDGYCYLRFLFFLFVSINLEGKYDTADSTAQAIHLYVVLDGLSWHILYIRHGTAHVFDHAFVNRHALAGLPSFTNDGANSIENIPHFE